MEHQYNDFGICVKCQAQKECPGQHDNPDNTPEPPKKKHKWTFYMNGSFCSYCGEPIGSERECTR